MHEVEGPKIPESATNIPNYNDSSKCHSSVRMDSATGVISSNGKSALVSPFNYKSPQKVTQSKDTDKASFDTAEVSENAVVNNSPSDFRNELKKKGTMKQMLVTTV